MMSQVGKVPACNTEVRLGKWKIKSRLCRRLPHIRWICELLTYESKTFESLYSTLSSVIYRSKKQMKTCNEKVPLICSYCNILPAAIYKSVAKLVAWVLAR